MANDAKRPGVWGIDLGQCALKAIRLEEEDGAIKATAFDYIEHPKILNQPDADADQLTREALEGFLSRNDLKGDLVAISVPGLNGLARFVKLPPVDEKKIPDIVRFEAKQQIPFPLHEVVWGFQRLGGATKNDNMVMDAEIGLFAMKRDMIAKSLQHFKDVGVEVHFIQMAPLALCNFLAHDRLGKGAAKTEDDEDQKGGDKDCVVGLDIGSDNSNLVITDGERIIWQRPIPVGGNHFTRALTKDLKLTFAKAEHLKRNAIKSPDLKKILAALKPVLNDFVSEVQRSLGYFTNTHRDANIQYMLGLGNAFRLPGLQKYLQEKLQLEVRKLQKIERLDGEETVTAAPQFVENLLSFGVAHGLALQGLNATRIHTNLLPPEIAQERAVRAKKPWAVAAAAVLLLITPPLLLGWTASLASWTSDGVKNATKLLAREATDAAADLASFTEYELKAEESRKRMLKLAGGVNERLNWLALNTFINEALPRPDGSHLVKEARDGSRPYQKYFDARGKNAAQRWPELKAKLADGSVLTTEEQKELEDVVKRFLVQVQIEGVAALYSDNLQKDKVAVLLATQGLIIPTGGWVVEIRGYTYHNDRENFVKNTLVENLIDLAEPDPKNRRLADVKLPPEVETALREEKDGVKKARVAPITLFTSNVDSNPLPGRFYKISTSPTAFLLGIWGYKAPPAVPGQKKDTGPQLLIKGGKTTPPDRKSWRPPMSTGASESFGAQLPGAAPKSLFFTAPAPGGGPGGPAPVRIIPAPRTEFVVWLIWQEPQTVSGSTYGF